MIRQLKIRDFRSIRAADLVLGRVNVFIGPNGAGKSNILEAVGVLAAAAGRGIDHRSLAERGVRTSLPRMFKAAFARRRTPPSVSIEATLDGPTPVRYKVALGAGDDAASLDLTHEGLWEGGAQVLGRGPTGCKLHRPTDGDTRTVVGDAQRSLWDQYGSVCRLSPSTREAMNKLAAFGIYAPETAVMRGTAVERQSRRPLGLSGSGLAGAVFEMLTARDQHTAAAWDKVNTILFLSGWANELIVSQRRADVVPPELATDERVAYFRDRFMKEGRDLLSAFDASEGTLYLAFHATLVAHPATPPWLAVDNVDAGLNPRVVRRLVQYMADIVCDDAPDAGPVCQQLLFTSHQPTALDGLDLFNPEHRLFVVSRGKDGATAIRPVAPPPGATRESWAATHGGSTLSKLLIDGAIRGALAEVL